MTGYGDAICNWNNKEIEVQIIALNSRSFDLHMDVPVGLRCQLLTWRNLIEKHLQRGRIELTITIKDRAPLTHLLAEHTPLIKTTFAQLKTLTDQLDTTTDLLGWTLRLLLTEKENQETPILSSPPYNSLEQALIQAVEKCKESRTQEGERLKNHFFTCLSELQKFTDQISAYLPQRKKILEQKLLERKQAFQDSEDAPMWEKEFAQYADKISLEEESIRLQSHIRYLSSTLQKGYPIGKTIGFIMQEAVREVNTIGAKAQDIKLQHLAIQVKELLEQIKEQAQNIL